MSTSADQVLETMRQSVAAQEAPAGSGDRFIIRFTGLEIRKISGDDPNYSKPFYSEGLIEWGSADYGTVVAVQTAMQGMRESLTQLGAARLQALNSSTRAIPHSATAQAAPAPAPAPAAGVPLTQQRR
jgi:hypothetical protein